MMSLQMLLKGAGLIAKLKEIDENFQKDPTYAQARERFIREAEEVKNNFEKTLIEVERRMNEYQKSQQQAKPTPAKSEEKVELKLHPIHELENTYRAQNLSDICDFSDDFKRETRSIRVTLDEDGNVEYKVVDSNGDVIRDYEPVLTGFSNIDTKLKNPPFIITEDIHVIYRDDEDDSRKKRVVYASMSEKECEMMYSTLEAARPFVFDGRNPYSRGVMSINRNEVTELSEYF